MYRPGISWASPSPFPGSDFVMASAFDREGRFCLVANYDGTIVLVDAATGDVRQRIKVDDLLTTATLCSGDKFVCTGGATGNVQLWNVETGKPSSLSLSLGTRITALTSSVATSSVLVGTADGSVGLWNTESGDFQQSRRHRAEVVSLCFGARDKLVVSGSWDHRACIHENGAGKHENGHLSSSRRSRHDTWRSARTAR